MSVTTLRNAHTLETPVAGTRSATDVVVPVARALFAAIFVSAGPAHFNPATIAYAASTGLPFASFLVPASGVLAVLGGLSVLTGWHARLGAAALAAFLVPVTLTMHAFWAVKDPMAAMMQYSMFMKNVGLLGGALLIAHFGAGPFSLDARRAAPTRVR